MTTTKTLAKKFAGKKIVLAPQGSTWCPDSNFVRFLQVEGATIESEVTSETDIVVTGRMSLGSPKGVKEAIKLNGDGASIDVFEEQQLLNNCKPRGSELADYLRSKDEERIEAALSLYWGDMVTISGEDLKGVHLRLCGWRLTEVDLTGATIEATNLILRSVKLENARIERTSIQADNCDFKGATISGSRDWSWICATECDFTDTVIEDFEFQDPKQSKFSACTFNNTKFSKLDFQEVSFYNSTFVKTALHGNKYLKSNFSGTTLKDYDLSNLDLTRVNFAGADLRGSTFAGSNLFACDFSGARLENNDFTDAFLLEAKVDARDENSAQLIDIVSKIRNVVGDQTKAFQKIAEESFELKLTFCVRTAADTEINLEVQKKPYWASLIDILIVHENGNVEIEQPYANLTEAVENLAWKVRDCHLIVESIALKLKAKPGQKMTAKEATPLAIAALCEVFRIDVPDEKERKKLATRRRKAFKELTAERTRWLSEGKEGIEKWNQLTEYQRKNLPLKKIDLSGLNLTGAILDGANLENAVLNECILKDARFTNVNLKKASLKGCTIDGTRLVNVALKDTDLSDTNISNSTFIDCKLHSCNFERARLTSVIIRGSDLNNSRLPGARLNSLKFEQTLLSNVDFSTASIQDTAFDKFTTHDDSTHFPAGFDCFDQLFWVGDGPDPARAKAIREAPIEDIDFSELLKRMEKHLDAARIKKAMKMLKEESFELFSEISDDRIVGVVKSQTNPDLVYACVFSGNGRYCCGTQNLNVCGGLRGALCKHLLVLLIGLTKASKLEPGTADVWVQISTLAEPQMDKETMAEVFLKYKGSEAGEIDWRPVETIPEDFYAF